MDGIRATPYINPLLGSANDIIGGLLGYMRDPRRTQQMQGLAGLLESTGIPKTVERLAFGEPLTNIRQANVPLLRPETAEALLTLAPVPPAAGRATMAVGRAGERLAERVVPQVMERGGMPAGLLEGMSSRTVSPLTVYHGSPYRFQRFDPTKIGSGEGAQAYGYGHYVAESPVVAKEYREKLSKSVTVDGQKLTSIPSDSPMAEAQNMVVRAIQDGMTPQQAIAHTKKYWIDAADEIVALKQSHPELAGRIDSEAASRRAIAAATNSMRPESFVKDPGALYTIDLPDSAIARMLDWDKPLSQQPDIVKRINPQSLGLTYKQLENGNHAFVNSEGKIIGNLQKGGTQESFTKNWTEDVLRGTGSDLYRQLGQGMEGGPKVSSALRQAGIPGIRYLDQGSRGIGEGTSNFVVFPGNEDLLTILRRNGGLLD